jgi:hypothetical protein
MIAEHIRPMGPYRIHGRHIGGGESLVEGLVREFQSRNIGGRVFRHSGIMTQGPTAAPDQDAGAALYLSEYPAFSPAALAPTIIALQHAGS